MSMLIRGRLRVQLLFRLNVLHTCMLPAIVLPALFVLIHLPSCMRGRVTHSRDICGTADRRAGIRGPRLKQLLGYLLCCPRRAC